MCFGWKIKVSLLGSNPCLTYSSISNHWAVRLILVLTLTITPVNPKTVIRAETFLSCCTSLVHFWWINHGVSFGWAEMFGVMFRTRCNFTWKLQICLYAICKMIEMGEKSSGSGGLLKKGEKKVRYYLSLLELQKQLETVAPLVNPPCYSGLTNLLNALWVISRNCWPPSLRLTIPLCLQIPAFFHSLTAVCESFSLLRHLSVKPAPTCRGKKRLRDHFTDHQLSHQLRG